LVSLFLPLVAIVSSKIPQIDYLKKEKKEFIWLTLLAQGTRLHLVMVFLLAVMRWCRAAHSKTKGISET
jgi:hypothetical protein